MMQLCFRSTWHHRFGFFLVPEICILTEPPFKRETHNGLFLSGNMLCVEKVWSVPDHLVFINVQLAQRHKPLARVSAYPRRKTLDLEV